MDEDLNTFTPDLLLAEVKRLRAGIRDHRDSSLHELCWYHPQLWGLLPERSDPSPVVPAWPQFLRGCLRYRESLDEQLPHAPRSAEEFNPDEGAIRDLVEAWAAAVRRKDLAGILQNHCSDILMFDVPPPLESRGIESYRRTWNIFFEWSHDPVRFDIVNMHVTAGADVAFAAAVMRCAGREKTGEDIELTFRLTIGLRKADGQWVVTHEHHSIPAES